MASGARKPMSSLGAVPYLEKISRENKFPRWGTFLLPARPFVFPGIGRFPVSRLAFRRLRFSAPASPLHALTKVVWVFHILLLCISGVQPVIEPSIVEPPVDQASVDVHQHFWFVKLQAHCVLWYEI